MGLLKTTLRRMTVAAACMAMVCAVSACGSSSASSSSSPAASASATVGSGAVGIFTPSDGLTLSDAVPLNRWNSWGPALADALTGEGFAKSAVSSTTSSSLEDQSQDIQDYVVDHVNSLDDASSKRVTLVVAPVVVSDEASRYYGDFISQPSPVSVDGSDDAAAAGRRLVSALTLAKHEGMRVVLVANTVEGFTPDAFVSMASAQDIGRMQAQQVVAKLQLDDASAKDPAHVEVLLPYDGGDAVDTAFAAQAFVGVWQVLQPYFQRGVVVSPSGRLTGTSTVSDWDRVAFEATKTEQVKHEVRDRLGGDGQRTVIDGVVAMNDFVASGVVAELTDLGYTGSAADVNPSITIAGIVNSLGGRPDLDRRGVPDPSAAGDGTDADDTRDRAQDHADWPIVTGYGAYTSNLPNIVNSKQWVTGFESRDVIARDTAKMCAALDRGEDLNGLEFTSTSTMNDATVSTLRLPLVPVSAQNLKAELIDPGYVSLADAGL